MLATCPVCQRHHETPNEHDTRCAACVAAASPPPRAAVRRPPAAAAAVAQAPTPTASALPVKDD